ncbi:unnamed protein product [Cylicostephanus goldi]|uniref:Transthyretin/hydroxyisourate hydrolase domain-containing protein n=1 Tax=Cylicostephanus goldi TaxID=71465 RepID=A0A3P6RDE2_CYLGO|nr:unnamed protein product [Cylicostephanus goldi]
MLHYLLFLPLALACSSSKITRKQAVGVTGQLMCGDQPATGVKVMLWDEDTGPDPDDKLDEGVTDSNGKFSLQVSRNKSERKKHMEETF